MFVFVVFVFFLLLFLFLFFLKLPQINYNFGLFKSLVTKCLILSYPRFLCFSLSTGVVEYTNCFSGRGKTSPQRVSWFDIKQSDGEVLVTLENWRVQNTSSLPLFPGPLWPRVVAPDRVLFTGQIQLNCILKLNCLK